MWWTTPNYCTPNVLFTGDEAGEMITGVFFIIALIHSSQSRGPHHPRGEAVVKHVHYKPTKTAPEKLTQDAELLHDKEHLQVRNNTKKHVQLIDF